MLLALVSLALLLVYILTGTELLILKAEKVLTFLTLILVFMYVIFEKRGRQE